MGKRYHTVTQQDETFAEGSVPAFRRGEDVASATPDFAGGVEKNPLLRGMWLPNVQLSASTTAQFVDHGLGRPFRGIWLCGQSTSGTLVLLFRPEDVTAAGYDPAKVFAVKLTSAVSVRVNLYIF